MNKCKIILILCLCIPGLTLASPNAVVFDQVVWENALKNFQKTFTCKGCNPKHVELITKAQINPTAIRFKFLNILWSAPSTNKLAEYTTKDSIKKVDNFIKENKEDLCRTYQDTKVDPMILTSLLYIETLFGSENIPWFQALDSIISLALLDDDGFADHVIEKLTPQMSIYDKFKNDPQRWKNYDWKKRAKWIAGDWIKHLEAYLQIAHMQGWDEQKVVTMKSSWAGAIGYSQFMPATALPYFQEEKTLDFWEWKDSFKLTSMYLRDKGFTKDAEKALAAYNSPKWYRDTITHLSHIMNKKHPDLCTAASSAGG